MVGIGFLARHFSLFSGEAIKRLSSFQAPLVPIRFLGLATCEACQCFFSYQTLLVCINALGSAIFEAAECLSSHKGSLICVAALAFRGPFHGNRDDMGSSEYARTNEE